MVCAREKCVSGILDYICLVHPQTAKYIDKIQSISIHWKYAHIKLIFQSWTPIRSTKNLNSICLTITIAMYFIVSWLCNRYMQTCSQFKQS